MSNDRLRWQRQRNVRNLGGNRPCFRLATFNRAGLGKSAADAEDALGYLDSLQYDALVLPETHGDHLPYISTRLIGSAPHAGNDTSHSGVAILLSERFAQAELARSDPARLKTSRICWVRVRGTTCNLYIVAVYLPYRNHVVKFDSVINILRDVLDAVPKHDCIVLLGDFNCQLARSTPGVTGKWCVAKAACPNGNLLTAFLRQHGLVAASTRFKPPRNASTATWIHNGRVNPKRSAGPGHRGISFGRKYLTGPNKGKLKLVESRPRLQLDYVCVSHRWSSCVTNSRVRWGPAIDKHQRHHDHGLVEITFKWRLRTTTRTPRHDLRLLQPVHDPETGDEKPSPQARAVANIIHGTLSAQGYGVNMESTDAMYTALTLAAKDGLQQLPPEPALSLARHARSDHTKKLIAQRKADLQANRLTPAQDKQQRRQLRNARKADRQAWIDRVVNLLEQAAAQHRRRDQWRYIRLLAGRTPPRSPQPSLPVQPVSPRDIQPMQNELWAQFAQEFWTADDQEANRPPFKWLRPPRIDNTGRATATWTRIALIIKRGMSYHTVITSASQRALISKRIISYLQAPKERPHQSVRPETLDKILEAAANYKSTGDAVPAEVYKYCKPARDALYTLLVRVVQEERLPPAMATIPTRFLFKSGDKEDRHRYRQLGSPTFPLKAFSSLVLYRLTKELDHVLYDTENGFRRGRRGSDNVFVLRELFRQAVDKGIALCMAATDLSHAFDNLSRRHIDDTLFQFGASDKTIALVRALFRAVILTYGKNRQGILLAIRPKKGVVQGDTMSPYLFILGLHAVLAMLPPPPAPPVLGNVAVPMTLYADDANVLTTATPNDGTEPLKNGGTMDDPTYGAVPGTIRALQRTCNHLSMQQLTIHSGQELARTILAYAPALYDGLRETDPTIPRTAWSAVTFTLIWLSPYHHLSDGTTTQSWTAKQIKSTWRTLVKYLPSLAPDAYATRLRYTAAHHASIRISDFGIACNQVCGIPVSIKKSFSICAATKPRLPACTPAEAKVLLKGNTVDCKWCTTPFCNVRGLKAHLRWCTRKPPNKTSRCTTCQVERIIDARGAAPRRFYQVHYKGLPVSAREWIWSGHLYHAKTQVNTFHRRHRDLPRRGDIEAPHEHRCVFCCYFADSKQGLLRHQNRYHTLRKFHGKAAKRTQVAKLQQHQNTWPSVKCGLIDLLNKWNDIYLGSVVQANGHQELDVQRRCTLADVATDMLRPFFLSKVANVDTKMRAYVASVASIATYCSEGWLLDKNTISKLNGVNSRSLALITGTSVHHQAKYPYWDIIHWIRSLRLKYLGRALQLPQTSILHAAVEQQYRAGRHGGLCQDAPPHRGWEHLRQLGRDKQKWKDMVKKFKKSMTSFCYKEDYFATENPYQRQYNKRKRNGLRGATTLIPSTTKTSRKKKTRDRRKSSQHARLHAKAFKKVPCIWTPQNPTQHTRARPDPIPENTLLIYTDGGCRPPCRPNSRAGSGVWFGPKHPHNIAQRLPGSIQTAQRAEVFALLLALTYAQETSNPTVIVLTDSFYSMQTHSRLQHYRENGWKTSKGRPMAHQDLWQQIDATTRRIRARHKTLRVEWVKAHAHIRGNVGADALATKGLHMPTLPLTATARILRQTRLNAKKGLATIVTPPTPLPIRPPQINADNTTPAPRVQDAAFSLFADTHPCTRKCTTNKQAATCTKPCKRKRTPCDQLPPTKYPRRQAARLHTHSKPAYTTSAHTTLPLLHRLLPRPRIAEVSGKPPRGSAAGVRAPHSANPRSSPPNSPPPTAPTPPQRTPLSPHGRVHTSHGQPPPTKCPLRHGEHLHNQRKPACVTSAHTTLPQPHRLPPCPHSGNPRSSPPNTALLTTTAPTQQTPMPSPPRQHATHDQLPIAKKTPLPPRTRHHHAPPYKRKSGSRTTTPTPELPRSKPRLYQPHNKAPKQPPQHVQQPRTAAAPARATRPTAKPSRSKTHLRQPPNASAAPARLPRSGTTSTSDSTSPRPPSPTPPRNEPRLCQPPNASAAPARLRRSGATSTHGRTSATSTGPGSTKPRPPSPALTPPQNASPPPARLRRSGAASTQPQPSVPPLPQHNHARAASINPRPSPPPLAPQRATSPTLLSVVIHSATLQPSFDYLSAPPPTQQRNNASPPPARLRRAAAASTHPRPHDPARSPPLPALPPPPNASPASARLRRSDAASTHHRPSTPPLTPTPPARRRRSTFGTPEKPLRLPPLPVKRKITLDWRNAPQYFQYDDPSIRDRSEPLYRLRDTQTHQTTPPHKRNPTPPTHPSPKDMLTTLTHNPFVQVFHTIKQTLKNFFV